MPYEIPSTSGSWIPPRGWYRDASGTLQYWDGQQWAAAQIPAPAPPAPAEEQGTPVWRVALLALGWVAAIVCLGLVLSGPTIAGVDCGTLFSPRAVDGAGAQAACAAALHSRATAAGVTALAALSCFAGASQGGFRVTGSRCLTGTPLAA